MKPKKINSVAEKNKEAKEDNYFLVAELDEFLHIMKDKVYPFMKYEPCGSITINFGKKTYNLELRSTYRTKDELV